MGNKFHLVVGAPMVIAQVVAQSLEQLLTGLGRVKILIRYRRIRVDQASDVQIIQGIIGFSVGHNPNYHLIGGLLHCHAQKRRVFCRHKL